MRRRQRNSVLERLETRNMMTSAVTLVESEGMRGGFYEIEPVQGGLVAESLYVDSVQLLFIDTSDPVAPEFPRRGGHSIAGGEYFWNAPTFLGSDGERIFFQQPDSETGVMKPTQVWTPQETFELREIIDGSQDVSFAGRLGRHSFYIATTESFGTELWSIDFEAGTQTVLDLSSGSAATQFSDAFLDWQQHLYFTASVAGGSPSLWRTDGTPAGTQQVGELPTGTSNTRFVPLVDQLLMVTTNGDETEDLWSIVDNDTDEQLTLLADSANSIAVTAAFDRAFVELDLGVGDRRELWSVGAPTAEPIGLLDESAPSELFTTEGNAWFVRDSTLYRTNGTIAGTQLALPDVTTVVGHTSEALFVRSNDQLVALRADAEPQVVDFPFEREDSTFILATDDSLYFAGREQLVIPTEFSPTQVYVRFWKTDGTPNGSGFVADWLSPFIHDGTDLTQLDHAWQVSDQIVFHATYESPDRNPDFEVLATFPNNNFIAHAGGELKFDIGEFELDGVSREYEITQGERLTLDASGSLAKGNARYEWDLDGDGEFDDAVGVNVDISWEQIREISAGHPFDAKLRVTTDAGQAFDQVHVSSPNRLAGDANLDGVVDFADFLILSANFRFQRATWIHGDFDNTGAVHFNDFLLLSENYGRRIP